MSRGTRHTQGRALRLAVDRARRRAQAQRERELHEAMADMRSALVEVQLTMFGLPDGDRTDRAVHLLSHPAWLIGMGAELAHAMAPAGSDARRLHGALRQVVDLCLRGYAWRTEYAPALERAAADSHALLLAQPEQAIALMPGAQYLSDRVRSRTVTRADVAGAELYAAGPETQPSPPTTAGVPA